jgi:predicted ribosome quality control (RQC) complex YloA/Tae2 family protein
MLIQQGDKNIRKLQKKNRELAQQVQDLQKTLEKKRTASNSREFKKYQKMHSQVLVSDLNEKLEDRRENLRNLQEKFDRVSDVVRKRETYLKDILGIKAKILERVEKMKEFDRCFSSTKLVTTKMLNDSSTVTRVRSSFK